MKRIFSLCCAGLLLLFLCSDVVYAKPLNEPQTIKETELFAQAAVLMDAASGRVLYGKNEDMQLAMASTTKIMTCIVALEQAGGSEVVTASAYAASQPKVKLYLNKGEQVLLEDLLYSLMLESHNDTAVAIAEHIGASLLGWENDKEAVTARTQEQSKEAVKAFIQCMNEKASQLQCYNTWFITPNGLDATEVFSAETEVKEERFHSTTAKELARIMSYCVMQSPKKEAFLKITGTYCYDFTNVEKTRSFVCNNHNAFLNMMEGAVSGKTGYTGRAGYCYVGALQRDGRMYIAALLNTGAYGSTNKSNKWKDTRKLMDFGLTYFSMQTIYDGTTQTEAVMIENGKKEHEHFFEQQYVPTVVSGDMPITMLLAQWEEAKVSKKQDFVLQAPIRKGQVAGAVEVHLNGTLLAHFDIICTQSIEKQTFLDVWNYVCGLFLLE